MKSSLSSGSVWRSDLGARVLDAEDAQAAPGAPAHEGRAIGEHAHLAGELAGPVDRDRLLELASGVNDLELAIEDDVERNVALALLEDDGPVLECPLDAERGNARELLRGERGEHLRAPGFDVDGDRGT